MGLIIITMYSALTPWATGWRSSASGLLMIVCVACVLLLTNNESDTMTRESDSQTSTSTIKELVKVDQMAKAWTQCHLDEHQGYYSPAHGKPCCVKYFHAANNECAAAHKSRLASSCASLQSEESDTSACEERVVTQCKKEQMLRKTRNYFDGDDDDYVSPVQKLASQHNAHFELSYKPKASKKGPTELKKQKRREDNVQKALLAVEKEKERVMKQNEELRDELSDRERAQAKKNRMRKALAIAEKEKENVMKKNQELEKELKQSEKKSLAKPQNKAKKAPLSVQAEGN